MAQLKLHMENLLKGIHADSSVFYTVLSDFTLTKENESYFIESFLPKLYYLYQKKVLRKDLVYLALLSSGNLDVLNLILEYDESLFVLNVKDPVSLYDYCNYKQQHWLQAVINTDALQRFKLSTNVYNKLLMLKFVQLTNSKSTDIVQISSLLSQINTDSLDKFWKFYIEEIERLVDIARFCNNLSDLSSPEIFKFATKNSLLDTLSVFVGFDDSTKWELIVDKIEEYETKDRETEQVELFTGFAVIATLVNLIVKKDSIFEKKDINKIVDNMRDKLLSLRNKKLQIELLENIFSFVFYRTKDDFVCGEKEVRLVLFLLKSVVDDLQLKKTYNKDSEEHSQLSKLYNYLIETIWRLDLVVNVKSKLKQENQLLPYMLAPAESLIHLCLKRQDFERAHQVVEIFDTRDTELAFEISYSEKLQDFKDFLRKRSGTSAALARENLDSFFQVSGKPNRDPASDLFDFAVTTARTQEDCRFILGLVEERFASCPDRYVKFYRKLAQLSKEVGKSRNIPTSAMLISPNYPLDVELYSRAEGFYETLGQLYDEFCGQIENRETGNLNKDHLSHATLVKINEICCQYLRNCGQSDNEQYLLKVFNYLQAFSKVLYIEENSSDIVSNGRNTSYFDLLTFNRSELTGRLLFERQLEPAEFEKYFGRLKLDFLYHVVGNCFPTINLHVDENVSIEELYHDNMLYVPTAPIIVYIQKRNWLLAFILSHMYKVEGVKVDISETRMRTFFNYMALPKIQHLKGLFENNETITALQNCISAQKVKLYLEEQVVKQDLVSITSLSSNNSEESYETGEEIQEDAKTTNWKELYAVIESIPENQLMKKNVLVVAKHNILTNIIQDGFELECCKAVHFITNRDLRVDAILANFRKWPGQFAVDVIKSEITRFDVVDDVKLEQLRDWLQKIELCEQLKTILDFKSWFKCYDFCKKFPDVAVEKILLVHDVSILLNFIELYKPVEEILCTIELNYVTKVIEFNTPFSQIKKLLDHLPFNHTINICNNLLTILRKIEYLQFIADYLNNNVTDDIFLKNIQVSLKMLAAFTHPEQEHLFCIINEPLSILEVLVMNTKLDKLVAVLEILNLASPQSNYDENVISIEKIDALLRKYAEKSLDFRVVTQPRPISAQTPELKLLQSVDSLGIVVEKRPFVVPELVPTKEEWVQNDEVLECMCCEQVTFSMFNRRHHCRRCGRVVCYNCSLKRMLVQSYGDILVRVCTDCYGQTVGNSCSSDRSDAPSSRSLGQEYWLLNDDPEHNKIMREEFSYEHAPSVSLCFSILKYHSRSVEYPKFLLEQCEVMLKFLKPNQEATHEIDYLLVIKMLKSLAVAGKMLSGEYMLNAGAATADRIISQAELLGLLAERGCLALMPVISSQGSYVDASILRRLRDKLLQREQWDLALEVSTKAGLDNTGIFAAWGKSCLKAGCLESAREKFHRCLDKTAHYDTLSSISSRHSDASRSTESLNRRRLSSKHSNVSAVPENKPNKDPPLLSEIVHILESKTRKIHTNVLQESRNIRLSGSVTSLNQSPIFTIRTDPALNILNRIKNLQAVAEGQYCVPQTKPEGSYARKPTIDTIFYNECVYYLAKYGTYLTLLEFYVKHGDIDVALNYILDNNLSCELFIEIYMKCLRDGLVKVFQDHMTKIDPSLDIWKNYLQQICRHLEKQNLLNSLYQLQLFMGDYVRAAITCIRFYQENVKNFSELAFNTAHLLKAEEHLRQIQEQDQWVEVSSLGKVSSDSKESFEEKLLSNSDLVMKIDCKDVSKHINTVQIQMEVVGFLAECEGSGVNTMEVLKDLLESNEAKPANKSFEIPTLFGTTFERTCLAVTTIVSDPDIERGFKIASKIIQEFKLRPIKIYCFSGKQLAKARRFNGITQLVTCIKSTGINDSAISDMLDEMLTLAVCTLTKANVTGTKVEDLIKLIKDRAIKISAYIEAKQLKTAYFLAVKYKRTADVRRIQREAELLNLPSIKALCQKYLQNHPQSSHSKGQNSN